MECYVFLILRSVLKPLRIASDDWLLAQDIVCLHSHSNLEHHGLTAVPNVNFVSSILGH